MWVWVFVCEICNNPLKDKVSEDALHARFDFFRVVWAWW